jgi:hypothetical protein
MAAYDPVPKKVGHKVTAAGWRWDADRKRWRLTQVCYEPIRGEPAPPPAAKAKAPIKRGALAAEQGQLAL